VLPPSHGVLSSPLDKGFDLVARKAVRQECASQRARSTLDEIDGVLVLLQKRSPIVSH
jgi:hypothetical protein